MVAAPFLPPFTVDGLHWAPMPWAAIVMAGLVHRRTEFRCSWVLSQPVVALLIGVTIGAMRGLFRRDLSMSVDALYRVLPDDPQALPLLSSAGDLPAPVCSMFILAIAIVSWPPVATSGAPGEVPKPALARICRGGDCCRAKGTLPDHYTADPAQCPAPIIVLASLMWQPRSCWKAACPFWDWGDPNVDVSWGYMIGTGHVTVMRTHVGLPSSPASAISCLTVLAMNLIGEGLAMTR